jgi:hypothetical protein
MNPKLNNVVIFSLDTANRPGTSQDYALAIKELDARHAQGSYKGVPERSLVVDISKLKDVIAMAKHYEQESILIVNEREAFLYYLDSKEELNIGTELVSVDKNEALAQDAYTVYQGHYYIVM